MTRDSTLKASIKLRPATLDDVAVLTAMSHQTILAKYPDVIGRDVVEGYVASGAVPAYYRDRNAYCIVAEINGEIVGVYATKDNAVDLMMVALAHHRTGIGSVLLKAAETQLFAKHSDLWLESFRDNEQANRFYTKHDWTRGDEYLDPAHGIAMIRFVK